MGAVSKPKHIINLVSFNWAGFSEESKGVEELMTKQVRRSYKIGQRNDAILGGKRK